MRDPLRILRFPVLIAGLAVWSACASGTKLILPSPLTGPVPTADPVQDLTDLDLHEMVERAVTEIEGCQNVMMDRPSGTDGETKIGIQMEGLADRTVAGDGRTRVDTAGAELKLQRRLERSRRFSLAAGKGDRRKGFKKSPSFYGYFETVRDSPNAVSIALNLELTGVGQSPCRARAEVRKSCAKTTRRGFCAPVPSPSAFRGLPLPLCSRYINWPLDGRAGVSIQSVPRTVHRAQKFRLQCV